MKWMGKNNAEKWKELEKRCAGMREMEVMVSNSKNNEKKMMSRSEKNKNTDGQKWKRVKKMMSRNEKNENNDEHRWKNYKKLKEWKYWCKDMKRMKRCWEIKTVMRRNEKNGN